MAGLLVVVGAGGLAALLFWGGGGSERGTYLPEYLQPEYPDATGVALFYTCDLQGRLVPAQSEEWQYLCKLGGLAHIPAVYEKWNEQRPRPDVIRVDVGNAAVADHEAAETVNRYTFDALDLLGCQVVNCGVNEAALPLDQLLNLPRGRDLQVISANLVRADNQRNVFPQHVILEWEDRKTGIIGLVRDDVPEPRLGTGVELINPADALKAAVTSLTSKDVHVIVVLAHMTPDQIYKLARKFPQVGVFLGGDASATSAPFEIENRSVIAYLADHGRTVGSLEAFFFPKEPDRPPTAIGRVSMVRADSPADDDLAALIEQFRSELADDQLPGAGWDPNMPYVTSFVGCEVCRLCHIKQYYQWMDSDHAGAYATLLMHEDPEAVGPIPRRNPKCLACHATGYRMPGGFDPDRVDELAETTEGPPSPREEEPELSDEERSQKVREKLKAQQQQLKRQQDALKGVGCEACHGGARRHLGAAIKDRLLVQESPQLRQGQALRSCLRCHTAHRPCLPPEKSDPYYEEDYLKKIKHWTTLPE
ncbi:MAG: multiheme c-type cytochrome [Candidatus Brocadiia bacterium]